ncbi:hypothetical protein GGP41_002564 [Bipolaris sorokiniana]|uniref:Uncharacterized protein n=1 Tax=Cochliobolus sativus TaxID=45130 RepID=A0A8H5ZJB6_COCSA|nr:hypothetical protein GGP41_002564 [Bipolaris sorokiniana]
MSSSHSNTTTTATMQAPPVYSTLSPPSYTASASSDTHSVLSGASISKEFLGRMWNSRHEEKNEKKGKGKEDKQREVEEKEARAAARAAYFALQ